MCETGKAQLKLTVIKRTAFAWALFLIVCSIVSPAQGASKYDPPVYNPHTKSYFQLFRDNTTNWDSANKLAKTKYHKGVAGRLAHVEDMETHTFLLANLAIKKERNPVWIGLRYWCRLKMLQWTSDRAYSPSDPEHFRIWHTNWSHHGSRVSSACDSSSGPRSYVPVYYRTINGVTRWQAIGAGKFYVAYIVEYLTGGE